MRGLCGFHHATFLPCIDGATRDARSGVGRNDDEGKKRTTTQSVQATLTSCKSGTNKSQTKEVHFGAVNLFPCLDFFGGGHAWDYITTEAAALSRPVDLEVGGFATAAVLRCAAYAEEQDVPVESSEAGRPVGRAVSWRGNCRFCSDLNLHLCPPRRLFFLSEPERGVEQRRRENEEMRGRPKVSPSWLYHGM